MKLIVPLLLTEGDKVDVVLLYKGEKWYDDYCYIGENGCLEVEVDASPYFNKPDGEVEDDVDVDVDASPCLVEDGEFKKMWQREQESPEAIEIAAKRRYITANKRYKKKRKKRKAVLMKIDREYSKIQAVKDAMSEVEGNRTKRFNIDNYIGSMRDNDSAYDITNIYKDEYK